MGEGAHETRPVGGRTSHSPLGSASNINGVFLEEGGQVPKMRVFFDNYFDNMRTKVEPFGQILT